VARADELAVARGQTAQAFAAVPPRTLVKLFDAVSTPFRGMYSALAPYALQPGQFSVCQNLRADDRSLKCRQPTTDQSATGLPSNSSNGSFPNSTGDARGMWAGLINGVAYVVAAAYDGTKVGLYFSTDGIAFTAATQTSGAYGDSRLTDTGTPVSFQVATNPADGLDYLIVQNGTDNPRAFHPALVYGTYVKVIQQFASPDWATSTKVQGVLPGYYNPGSASYTGANPIVATITGTTPYYSIGLAFPTTITANCTVTIDFGVDGLDLSACGNQLLFMSDQPAMNCWNSWKVQVSPENSTWTTISDPTSANYNAPVRVPFSNAGFGGTSATGGLNGEEVVAFNLGSLTPSTIAAQRYMLLTWTGPTSYGSSFTTTIHAVFASGANLAFQQQFAISYSGLAGLSESAGVVMGGFPDNTSTLVPSLRANGIYFPYLAGVYYDYQISLQWQTLAQLQIGVDRLNVYRSDYSASGGFGDYFYFTSATMGTYVSPWEYNGGSTTTPIAPYLFSIPYTLTNSTVPNVSRYLPDAYAISMPIGSALAFGNTRFVVGGLANGAGFYACSEANQPFRYRLVTDITVQRSAVYETMPGDSICGFAAVSLSGLSANAIFMFSQKSIWVISGFDGYSLSQPNKIAEVGCSAPKSISYYKDALFWLDDNLQIRRFSYGRASLYGYTNANAYDLMPAISKQVVSDRTTGIPVGRLAWACGVATFDRYYLFYTPSGSSTNVRALVFDETIGVFVEDTLSVGGEAVCVGGFAANGKQILFQGLDGGVYWHENPGSSAAVGCSLVTRELSDGMWNPMFFGRIGVVIDRAGSAGSMSITKTLKPVGATDSSSIDLYTIPVNQSGVAQQWRWDSRASSTQPGLGGVSSVAAMSWTMTPGTRLYSIVQEVQKGIAGADQV
jgi:hypothetical protein